MNSLLRFLDAARHQRAEKSDLRPAEITPDLTRNVRNLLWARVLHCHDITRK